MLRPYTTNQKTCFDVERYLFLFVGCTLVLRLPFRLIVTTNI
ncbi:unnamed protein product [Haemonchus placei]|uniref:7TM_GPCR_Srx domain-containing protein n=1 Tax=Haemonchus placei TaxID=6290 RepID=A0A0N4W2U4_HAEPC|nr:unnamed protein product [Haemonchus placei]